MCGRRTSRVSYTEPFCSSDSLRLDPIFISLIGNILETLASCPAAGIYEIVVKRALPPLCQALDTAKLDESWIVSSALELLSGIIEGADAERGLGTGFFAALAPQLFKCLTTAEDRDVLQVRYCLNQER